MDGQKLSLLWPIKDGHSANNRTPIYRVARGKGFCPVVRVPGISGSKSVNLLNRGKFILPVNRGSGKSGSDCTSKFVSFQGEQPDFYEIQFHQGVEELKPKIKAEKRAN
eukprot:sb/3477375/